MFALSKYSAANLPTEQDALIFRVKFLLWLKLFSTLPEIILWFFAFLIIPLWVYASLHNKKFHAGTYWSILKKRSATTLKAILFGILRLLLKLLMLILPGLRFYPALVFAPFAVLLRNQGTESAATYSEKILEGKEWRAFFHIFGFAFLFTTPFLVFEIATRALILGNFKINSPWTEILVLFLFLLENSGTILVYIASVIIFVNYDVIYHSGKKETDDSPSHDGIFEIKP